MLTHTTPTPDGQIEAAAKAIYALFPDSRHGSPRLFPWQPGGNSIMQDEARKCARAALGTIAQAAPAGDSSVTLCDEVAIAAEMWANAEYAEAKELWRGGSSDGEACAAAEDKFRTLLDKLTTERAATQPAGEVIEMLLEVTRLAHDAMDDTEEDGAGLHWNRDDFDNLSAALDKLDALPDDKPGYIMGPAEKAAWAMRVHAAPESKSETSLRDIVFDGPDDPHTPAAPPDSTEQRAATAAKDSGEVHPDDLAVDRFAAAMKAKMAASRLKGRSGWDDPERCSVEKLAAMLCRHVEKGGPVDIANFAMMIHQRGGTAIDVYEALAVFLNSRTIPSERAATAAPSEHDDPTHKNHPGHHEGHTCEAMGQMLADFGSQRTTPEKVVAAMSERAATQPAGITLTKKFAADVLGALFWRDTINPEGYESIKQEFAALMRGDALAAPISEDAGEARPAAVMAGGLSDDVAAIMAEVQQARDNWPPFNSAHEGFAVLAEEVDELWDHIKTNQKRRDLPAMRKEAMQVAAMALRFMGECCDETTGRK